MWAEQMSEAEMLRFVRLVVWMVRVSCVWAGGKARCCGWGGAIWFSWCALGSE